MEFTHPDDCDCYECVGRSTGGNMKHHTFGEPCENCGKPKSEYRDLGRKGYYTCWWCEERAGGPKS